MISIQYSVCTIIIPVKITGRNREGRGLAFCLLPLRRTNVNRGHGLKLVEPWSPVYCLCSQLREQEFTKIPLMNFILSNQKQPIPHLAPPLKEEELSPFPFKGKVRMGMG